jgi:Acyl-CoA synthetases (AMP-forming)/AMP-acid ligases II
MSSRTIFQVLDDAAARYRKAIALHQPYHENGQRRYRTYTWQEYRDAALEIAAGLRALGMARGTSSRSIRRPGRNSI